MRYWTSLGRAAWLSSLASVNLYFVCTGFAALAPKADEVEALLLVGWACGQLVLSGSLLGEALLEARGAWRAWRWGIGPEEDDDGCY